VQLFPIPPAVYSIIYPSQPDIRCTSLFVIGVIAVVFGTFIRLNCFRVLGHLFTFDLTSHPDHKLVTDSLYSVVRHPSYAGSMLLVTGLTFSHLTPGSYLTECRMSWKSVFVIIIVWWAWTWSVGTSRAAAEDKQMKKLFGSEWNVYAARVPCWFFPGIY
jgi:protein-S-isoprenylcysteine O-methyltransferase Ste14